MRDPQLPQRWVAPPPAPEVGPRDVPMERETTLKSVLQFLALLRRHWILVIGITAASVGMLIYKVRNEPRIYRAMATIRLQDKARELSNGIGRAPMSQTYRPFNDPVLTQIQVLQSQAVAESVAEREGLRVRALPKWQPVSWATDIKVSATVPPDTIHALFGDSRVTLRSRVGQTEAPYGMALSLGGVQFVVPRPPGIRSAELSIVSTEFAANEV